MLYNKDNFTGFTELELGDVIEFKDFTFLVRRADSEDRAVPYYLQCDSHPHDTGAKRFLSRVLGTTNDAELCAAYDRITGNPVAREPDERGHWPWTARLEDLTAFVRWVFGVTSAVRDLPPNSTVVTTSGLVIPHVYLTPQLGGDRAITALTSPGDVGEMSCDTVLSLTAGNDTHDFAWSASGRYADTPHPLDIKEIL